MPNETGKAADKKKDLEEAIAESDTTLTKVKGEKSRMQATRLDKSEAAALLAEFKEKFIWVIREDKASGGSSTGTTTGTSTGTSTDTSTGTSTDTSTGTSGYVTLMMSRTQPGSDG